MADTIVITDGGPAGLLASWIEGTLRRDRSTQELLCWFDARDDETRAPRLERVGELAGRCEHASVIEPHEIPSTTTQDSRQLSQALLAVAQAALDANASRVVWPVQGATVDAMASIVDRALLVGELVSLDSEPQGSDGGGGGERMPGDGVVIETPFADLSDGQIADLIFDCDAPISLAWWCESPGPQPCGECDPCARWQPLFQQAIPLV